MLLPSNFVSCPGLFYPTPARDGILSRIRVPGGIITSQQFELIADLADKFGNGNVNITNRANLQLRHLNPNIPADVITTLQKNSLASAIPEVDHLRNIMGSPTAGIDIDELIDTQNIINELDKYIATHPELAVLSAKFSIACDGGGSVSITTQSNDILLAAILIDSQVYFQLRLNLGISPVEPFLNTPILIKPSECVAVIAALTKAYLYYSTSTFKTGLKITHRKGSKPRLKDILNYIGVEEFIQQVNYYLDIKLLDCSEQITASKNSYQQRKYIHIGVHPQKQQNLSYIGVVVPLGSLHTLQMRALADISQTYGDGTLRLTPWQNLLLTHIPNQHITTVKSQIENIKLHWSTNNIYSSLVACTGNQGCSSSATDTKTHAIELAKYLDEHITLNQPINIHFSGCEKSCAQPTTSDITLLGVYPENKNAIEEYDIYIGDYIGDGEPKFGKEIFHHVPFPAIPPLIKQILQLYLEKRQTPNQSFREFLGSGEIGM